jgi:hypothetical protein
MSIRNPKNTKAKATPAPLGPSPDGWGHSNDDSSPEGLIREMEAWNEGTDKHEMVMKVKELAGHNKVLASKIAAGLERERMLGEALGVLLVDKVLKGQLRLVKT